MQVSETMADIYDIGEPESSEGDSVSLTSTIDSDGEGKEYEVDRILAESTTNGTTWYLTQWTGYPEYRCTWQPIDTFIESGSVFKSWKEEKMRVSRGYEKAFNVKVWERRQREEIERARHRRERRARKKTRLNRQIDSLPSDPEDEVHVEKPNKRTKELIARASSNSSSEDDDSRSPAQTISKHAASNASWTNEEQQTFIEGLQEAKGPYWNDILAWYGHRGSINRLLEKKSRRDMQMHLEALKKEFTTVGRDPPEYMNLPKSPPASEAPKMPDPTNRCHSEEVETDDSGASMDSMLADIREKEVAKENLTIQHPDRVRKEEVLPTKTPSRPSRNNSTAGSSRSKPSKNVNSPPMELSNIPKGDLEAALSHPGGPQRDATSSSKPFSVVRKGSVDQTSRPGSIEQPIVHEEPTRQPYSGTARATTSRTTTDEPLTPHQSRVGVIGSGPARLPISRPITHSRGPPPHSRNSGIDVTANWGTLNEPKTRKAVGIPTTNAATGSKPPGKLFTWSRRNVVLKGRKKEPAPNLAEVVLLNPKTGRPPKPLPASSAVTSDKTPLQTFQEQFAAKEAEERHTTESEHPVVNESASLIVGINVSSTGVDEQVKDGSAGFVTISSPDKTSSAIVERSDRTSTPRSPPPRQPTRKQSQDTGLPPNVPLGPRAGTEVSALPPLNPNPHHFVTRIPPNPTSGAVSSLTQAQQLGSSLPLTLMGNPTPQERRELWGKTETDQVYGNLKIGSDLEDIGRMKLMGCGWYVKRLLLANKNRINPKDMGLEFKKICAAVEYQNYMHDVCCSCLYLHVHQLTVGRRQ